MATSKDFFDDVFNAYGDDNDIHEDETVDFDYLAIEMETKSEIKVLHDDNVETIVAEEQRLSQRLSQLSASNESTTHKRSTTIDSGKMIMKRFKTDTRTTNEHMPIYLQASHGLFDETMLPLLQQLDTSSITIEDLREMANFMHDLRSTKLSISEWEIYLQSGTGQLKVFFPQQEKFVVKTNPSIWPSEVKRTMLREAAINAQTESDIDDQYCLSFTQNYLRRLHTNMQVLEIQLNELKQNLNEFTEEMYETIERYIVQHYINEANLRTQKNILVVEYNYRDRLLELEFEHLKPNERQLHLYRELYQLKVDYEKSKANVDILKQYVFYKIFPDIFDSFRLPSPPQIELIMDQSLRQTLYNRYERIVQQTKSDLMAMHIAVAEAKMRQCQRDLQRRDDQQWTEDMMILIQRRFKDYEERIRRLYNLKLNFFVKAPTVSAKNM